MTWTCRLDPASGLGVEHPCNRCLSYPHLAFSFQNWKALALLVFSSTATALYPGSFWLPFVPFLILLLPCWNVETRIVHSIQDMNIPWFLKWHDDIFLMPLTYFRFLTTMEFEMKFLTYLWLQAEGPYYQIVPDTNYASVLPWQLVWTSHFQHRRR